VKKFIWPVSRILMDEMRREEMTALNNVTGRDEGQEKYYDYLYTILNPLPFASL
jgi:hypothetical protein